MATQDLSNIQYDMLEAALPDLVNQVEQSSPLLMLFQKQTDRIEKVGRNLYAYIHNITGENWGVGFAAESAAMPTPGRVTFDRMYVPLKYLYGSVSITGQAEVAGRQEAAFEDAVDLEIRTLVKSVKSRVGFALSSDGSGTLGKGVSVSSATWTMADTNAAPGVAMFRKGMIVDSYDARTSGNIGVDGLTVSAVDVANTTITLSATTGISGSVADYVYLENEYGYTMMGILGLIDAGTFATSIQGVTRATAGNEWSNAVVLGNSSTERELSLDLFAQAIDRIEVNEGTPRLVYGNHLLRRQYFALLEGNRSYPSVSPVTLDGGVKGMKFTWGNHELTWIVDQYCPKGRAFIFNPKDFVRVDATNGPEWINDRFGHSGPLHQNVGYDTYAANLRWYLNVGAKYLNHCCRIDDLKTS